MTTYIHFVSLATWVKKRLLEVTTSQHKKFIMLRFNFALKNCQKTKSDCNLSLNAGVQFEGQKTKHFFVIQGELEPPVQNILVKVFFLNISAYFFMISKYVSLK